jgi:histidine ammonia-lyase
VSFRVAPQVLAQLWRVLGPLDEDGQRALAAVTDSPAVVGGRVVAGGGFHAAGLAAGMDAAAVALVQAAEQLRRVQQLAHEVVACELLAAHQAWRLRRRPPAPGLRPLAACLEELVAPVGRDRPLGPDLDRLVGVLERNELPVP